MHPQRAVTHLEVHVIAPIERVAESLADGPTDHVVGTSAIIVFAKLLDFPNACLALAVTIQEPLVEP